MKYLNAPKRAVALRDHDADSLRRSASGGAFALFARLIIAQGGVVFGSKMFDDGFARHIGVDDLASIEELQGSKYVQSLVGDTYQDCLKCIRDNRVVLYSGTPCQIYALRAFLERAHVTDEELKRLVCVDLICHGTPCPDLFRLHQDWLGEKHGADNGIHGYVFRSKLIEWGLYYYYYYYYKHGSKHEVFGSVEEDPYYKAFLECGIFRKGCYKCPFAQGKRVGDLTIGDYWGIEVEHPEFDVEGGCSAVLINTDKGEAVLNSCCSDCDLLESSFEQVAKHNANLLHPSVLPESYCERRDAIDRAVRSGDYHKLFDELLVVRLTPRQKLKKCIPLGVLLKLRRLKSLIR